MSDIVWQVLIGAGVTIVLAWMSQRTKNAVEKTGKDAAAKVEEVRETLGTATATADGKLDVITKTGEVTHTLVNSNMGVQLKLNKVPSRRVADMTGEKADIEAAELADKPYQEHITKQATVDAAAAKGSTQDSVKEVVKEAVKGEVKARVGSVMGEIKELQDRVKEVPDKVVEKLGGEG